MASQIEREEEDLYRQFDEGWIDREELNRLIRELHRDYAEAAMGRAEEAAEEAYLNELERW